MSLSIDQVRHVAKLARMNMSDEELEHMLPHLVEMVEVFDRLRAVDTEGIEPTSHSVPIQNVWREDEARPADCGDILAPAHRSREGLFIVPGILDEE